MTGPSHGPAAAPSSYPEDDALFRELAAAEDRHFWFTARNKVIEAALCRVKAQLPDGARVLEIGCGTGNVLRVIERMFGPENVVGMDMFEGGLRYAHQRTHCALVQSDMHAPPFQTRFQIVGMFDVIEHFADDDHALRDARALLSPGGKLLLTVPAHMSLWSYADEFAGHQRRYHRRDLADKLTAAGFTVDYVTYFMATTFPIMWLKRRATSWTHKTYTPAEARDLFLKELRPVPGVNGILRWMAEKEALAVACGRVLPLGSSLIAVANA